MTSKIVLSGSLAFLGIGDILQIIGSSGATGVLRIISKYSVDPGYIYFSKGNIINGAVPNATGLDAVYGLFGWTEGDFEFTEEPVAVDAEITASRMEIILDGLRQMDDGKTPKLGPVTYEKTPDETRRLPLIRGPLVDYIYVLTEETFPKGYKIVQEKKHGNWIWVVLEGVVDIVRETPSGPLTILKLGSGSFIGSIASFMYQDSIRNATALAITDVQLGVLDTQRLAEEFATLSPDFRKFVLSIEKRRNEVTDRAVDIFIEKDFFKKAIKDKTVLIAQGKKDAKFYKITRGEACVARKTPNGYLLLAILRQGDFIGNMRFLDIGHEPQQASVFVSGDIEVTALKPEKLEEEYHALSSTFRNLIESIATSISITTRVACDFLKK